ncbi:TIM-barrel domain-containing protein [Bizionia sp. KMM 8389]
MKRVLCIGLLLLTQVILAQVTVLVEAVPEQTPEGASIFISGNFEGWSGGNKTYQLQKLKAGYSITLPKQPEAIQFKFTQGTWNSVECHSNGEALENRTYKFTQNPDTLRVKIEGWANLFQADTASTAASNVSVISEHFKIEQLDRERRVWIYLPPNYKASQKSYPVVYMHDGQNLFDKITSGYGEWGIDETLNKLSETKGLDLIVVGIDHGGDKRLDEYSPWKHAKYGGGEGDAYLSFLVETLKPYIDANYRTLPNREQTAIFGSSMGGLISHYAALKYPDVFGKVGVYSPAFWFAPQVMTFSQNHANLNATKMYFLAGGKEGEKIERKEISQTVKDMNSMISVLKTNGFSGENIQSKIVPEGKHNEKLWRSNFEETILWLFNDRIKNREFIAVKSVDNTLELAVSDGVYYFKFYTPQIAETTFVPEGEVVKPESHAVVLDKNFTTTVFSETSNEIRFATPDLSIEITKEPFHIAYWYQGEQVTSEKNGYQKTANFETLQFNLKRDEVLYGGGARALGMNRRGNRLQLYNKAHYGYETHSELMNFTMPIVISSNGYLLHFDNAPIGYLDLDSSGTNTLTYETISGRKTYQVVVGNSWLDLINNYTQLTGKQPMLPSWALGNFSSRFGYHSQSEVTETIAKYEAEDIPVDAVILDLFWFGKTVKGTMGNLEWDRDSFPNPKQMIKDLRAKNVETILVTEPFILTTSNRWDEAVKANILAKDSLGNPFTYDFYFGNTGLVDIYSTAGNTWFKNIYKNLAAQGVSGFWGDLGEPEVHPSDLRHATGSADEVHNIYGHDWAKLVYEANLEVNPNKRPFILMRAGYSGSQRYGLVPWSGDVNRTWGGLQSQPEIALQMGMQGLAYMHSDLGGFAGANLDDELYIRWLQYGVFQPIYRPHAQEEVASEPIFRSTKAKNLSRQAIKLRYALLPYNYNLMFENNQTGAPLMRPLFFDEPENKDLYDYSEAYLWGHDILVAPILKSGVTQKAIYFPKSYNWFDFYTDKKVAGGQIKNIPVTINSIPTYVRGGVFIPMVKPEQTTKVNFGNDWDLHYYVDALKLKSKQKFYKDDGHTLNAYNKNQYAILHVKAENKDRILEFEFHETKGDYYRVNLTKFNVIIHKIEKAQKYIKINNKKVNVVWDKASETLTIPVESSFENNTKIKIKLK